MIDPNEICGWINACTNAAFLEQLAMVVEKRLVKIGHPSHPPIATKLSVHATRQPAEDAIEKARRILQEREIRSSRQQPAPVAGKLTIPGFSPHQEACDGQQQSPGQESKVPLDFSI